MCLTKKHIPGWYLQRRMHKFCWFSESGNPSRYPAWDMHKNSIVSWKKDEAEAITMPLVHESYFVHDLHSPPYAPHITHTHSISIIGFPCKSYKSFFLMEVESGRGNDGNRSLTTR